MVCALLESVRLMPKRQRTESGTSTETDQLAAAGDCKDAPSCWQLGEHNLPCSSRRKTEAMRYPMLKSFGSAAMVSQENNTVSITDTHTLT